MRLLARFGRRVGPGDLTLLSLAGFRILFAVLSFLTLPDLTRAADHPAAWFDPPLGPLRLLPGWPPEPVPVALQVALVLSCAALAAGWRTTEASVSATASAIPGYGLLYSTGEVDRNFLAVVLPVVRSPLAGVTPVRRGQLRVGRGPRRVGPRRRVVRRRQEAASECPSGRRCPRSSAACPSRGTG